MKNRNLFYSLLEPVHPKAEAFCRKLAGNREDGDDLYQEGLLKALMSFESLRDHSAFKSWLYRILVNCHKNRARTSWWKRRVSLTAEMVESGPSHDPGGLYSARRRLKLALAVLKPEDRAMVVLSELEDWSIKELAQLFDKPQGTIKARLHRAKKKMLERLNETVDEQQLNESTGDRICIAVKRNTD
ncbi:MAG TPA: RNA polymerase sigma factor [candidate division Zixibacteria bacterium]|nr:RNA polymerase sigma factor [candidate division Zixibacteria bacterium]